MKTNKQFLHAIGWVAIATVVGIGGYFFFYTPLKTTGQQTIQPAPQLPVVSYELNANLDQELESEDLPAVTLIANSKQYETNIQQDLTAFDLMTQLANSTDFKFSGEEYQSLGFFVNEINGIKNSQEENKFWIMYVNGETSQVGVSEYQLKPGDVIEWKYEGFNYGE